MLKKHAIFSLSEVPFFPPIFLDYVLEKDSLKDFYIHPPQIESFANLLKNKHFSMEKRSVLQALLQKQYQGLDISPEVAKNIQLLEQANTFTVTTAHQPSIFFGELYFVFKTLATIRLAEALREQYPQYNFIPVFWLGSEDHDFAEISHFRLFGKTYRWQQQEQGAVGRMKPESLQNILQEMPEKEAIFEEAYHKPTLSEATRYALNAFFGDKGLLVVDGDSKELKSLFVPIIKKEVFSQKTFDIIQETNSKLNNLGYKAQATPRPINFFYLEEQSRKRIIQNGAYFEVLETDKRFSAEEMENEIQTFPEKFSPNALLRPIYQESVLPNLAYVGGPGELAYWLQLKEVFAYFSSEIEALEMPVLLPRYFGAILQKSQSDKMNKLDLQFSDLWKEADLLRKSYVIQHTNKEITLLTEKENLKLIFEQIKQKAIEIDKSLEASVAAEWQKTLKSIENLEKRLQKAEERNLETQINQILTLKDKLFPENDLQERKDNFLNFSLNNPYFLEDLYQNIQAFSFKFEVLEM